MNNNIITQSNELIRNINIDNKDQQIINGANKKSVTLAVQEKKLILYLISKIKPNSKTLESISVTFSEFCEVMEIERGGKQFELIKKAVSQLASVVFWIESDNKSYLCSWLSNENCSVDWDNKIINLKLSNTLAPYLLDLRENFTAYQLGFTVGFKGKYTYRLYEYLRSYMGLGHYLFPIEKFKKSITEGRYTKIADLERRVLNKAVQEINEFSDIIVSYQKIYKNPNKRSKTTHLEFIIDEKTEEEKDKIISKWNDIVTSADAINAQTQNFIPTKKALKQEEKWMQKYEETHEVKSTEE